MAAGKKNHPELAALREYLRDSADEAKREYAWLWEKSRHEEAGQRKAVEAALRAALVKVEEIWLELA